MHSTMCSNEDMLVCAILLHPHTSTVITKHLQRIFRPTHKTGCITKQSLDSKVIAGIPEPPSLHAKIL